MVLRTGAAHTHGVTQTEVGFTYSGESGAICESLSDMWGEWIDLLNKYPGEPNHPNDPNRWLIGEDLTETLRSMKNPNGIFGRMILIKILFWICLIQWVAHTIATFKNPKAYGLPVYSNYLALCFWFVILYFLRRWAW